MLSADWEIVSVPMAKSAAKQVSVTPPKFTSPGFIIFLKKLRMAHLQVIPMGTSIV
jgi:hypothetical protein